MAKKPERGWKAESMRKGIKNHPKATARELATLLTEEAKRAGYAATFSPQEIYGARSAKKGKRGSKRRKTDVFNRAITRNGRPAPESIRPSSVSEAIDHLQIAVRELGSAGVRKIMELMGK